MATNGIMKRRKRAQIGTILAILLILVPLPVGSMLVGNMNDFGAQTSLYTLDGEVDDTIFALGANETEFVKYLNDGTTLQGNYTEDYLRANMVYKNATGVLFVHDMLYSSSGSGVFAMPSIHTNDPAASLVYDVSANNPRYQVVSVLSPEMLLDAGASKTVMSVDGLTGVDNVTIQIGVYHADGDTIPGPGTIANIDITASAAPYIYVSDVVAVDNGTVSLTYSFDAEQLMTADALGDDGFVYFMVSDTEGGIFDENEGVTFNIEVFGPEKAYSLTSTWNAMLIVTGLIGLFGALVSTPYVSLESFSGDGMQGKRYRHGNNPRGGRSRKNSGNRNNRRRH